MKRIIKMMTENHFIRYLIVGIILTIFTSAIMGLLVDIRGFPSLAIYIPLTIFIFLIKYPTYKIVGLLGQKGFMHYVLAGATVFFILLGLSSVFVSITVDLLGFPAYIMSFLAVCINFVLRFQMYKILKVFRS